ncbi:hypothetical protein [Butyrivibrio sp.]|uniref:hypothetical protein n=1 Tax=Butyrivibrio sp. TaxID=28121 RepID=UPI0025BF7891|nr:hypothetical protein [Butyrivibrio sp.]MBE5959735.1 hypothetical protein [Lachnospiraceae bacterium]MBQ9305042.1 hypothetical protein [Butyrivibrio sp.]
MKDIDDLSEHLELIIEKIDKEHENYQKFKNELLEKLECLCFYVKQMYEENQKYDSEQKTNFEDYEEL